jgi:hypothetical protein
VVEKEGSSSSGLDAERSEAPTSSPNRQARGESREENRGWGQLGAMRRKENGGRGAWHGRTDCGVRMAPYSAVGGGSARSRWRRVGEQGGRRGPVSATGCGRERGM